MASQKVGLFSVAAAAILVAGDWTLLRAAETPESVLGRLSEASAEFRLSIARVRGEADLITHSGTKKNPKVIITSMQFNCNSGKTLVRRESRLESDASQYRETIFASDTEHLFLIERPSKSAPFSLTSFRGTDKHVRPGYDDFFAVLNRFLLAPISVSSVPAMDIGRNPHFKLGNVEKLPGEIFRVSYQFDDPELPYGSGWFEVSPSTGWLITKNQCRLGNLTSKQRVVTAVEYGPAFHGQSMPSHVNITQNIVNLDHIDVADFRLRSVEEDASGDSDYKPTKYGLPDLGRSTGSRGTISLSVVLIWLSPVVLLLALAARSLAKKLRRS